MKKIFAILLIFSHLSHAQNNETKPFTVKQLIIPTILVGGGLLTLGQDTKDWQRRWYQGNFSNYSTKADDYLSFAPTVVMYGLDLAGVKGKHNLQDQVILTLISNTIALGTSTTLKLITKVERPDGSSFDSFPSGHTTEAFVGATLLHEEYGDNSVAYSILGYGLTSTTGAMRMMNNRHWLSDVLVGAGIGIGATKLTYAIYPWLKRKVFKSDKMAIVPMYNGSSGGFVCLIQL